MRLAISFLLSKYFQHFVKKTCSLFYRFTAPPTGRGKTKFATVKWYNLCLQIIQSTNVLSPNSKSKGINIFLSVSLPCWLQVMALSGTASYVHLLPSQITLNPGTDEEQVYTNNERTLTPTSYVHLLPSQINLNPGTDEEQVYINNERTLTPTSYVHLLPSQITLNPGTDEEQVYTRYK